MEQNRAEKISCQLLRCLLEQAWDSQDSAQLRALSEALDALTAERIVLQIREETAL